MQRDEVSGYRETFEEIRAERPIACGAKAPRSWWQMAASNDHLLSRIAHRSASCQRSHR
jgi:hypothetical protein